MYNVSSSFPQTSQMYAREKRERHSLGDEQYVNGAQVEFVVEG